MLFTKISEGLGRLDLRNKWVPIKQKTPFLFLQEMGFKISVSFPSSEQGIQEQKSMRIIARRRKEVKGDSFKKSQGASREGGQENIS
jgi:hypothetical protein